MTTPSLLEIADRPDPAPVSRKRTKPRNVDIVADYFRARPNQWLDGFEFREFAGGYGGWSARIREARKRFGMRIDNRQTHRRDGSILSEYMYVPSSERQE